MLEARPTQLLGRRATASRASMPHHGRRTWRRTARAARSSWHEPPTRRCTPFISRARGAAAGPRSTRAAASRCSPRRARTTWRLTIRATSCPTSECARYVISPPLRVAGDRDALWGGLADGSLALIATDHVPDRRRLEKQLAGAVRSTASATARPGIETLLAIVYNEGVARGRITHRADGRRALDDAGPPVRPELEGRDRGRPRRRPGALRPDRSGAP